MAQLRSVDALTSVLSDWTFVAASAIMSTSIGLNAISEHATCTQVFVAVAAVVAWILTSIPTLSKLSWLAALGALSIMISSKQSDFVNAKSWQNQMMSNTANTTVQS